MDKLSNAESTHDIPTHIMLQTQHIILLCAIASTFCFVLSLALSTQAERFAVLFVDTMSVAFVLLASKVALWGICAQWLQARLRKGKRGFARAMPYLPFVPLGYGFSVITFFWTLPPNMQAQGLHSALVAAVEVAVVTGLFHAMITATQARVARAELRGVGLRSHIHNHFLFNAINTVVDMSHTQPAKVGPQLCKLADLFRAMLGEHTRVSLKDELELTRCYAEIERDRWDGRFDILWRIRCQDLHAISLPPMILHPLVENAIRYGVKERSERALIMVGVRRFATHVKCIVVNNVPRRQAVPGNGTALANVRRRLYDAFGNGGRLFVRQRSDNYAIHFTIPVPISAGGQAIQ